MISSERGYPKGWLPLKYWCWYTTQGVAYITLGGCLSHVGNDSYFGGLVGLGVFFLSSLLQPCNKRIVGHFVGWTTLGASFSYALTGSSLDIMTIAAFSSIGMLPLLIIKEESYRPCSFGFISLSAMVLLEDAIPFALVADARGQMMPILFCLLPMCGVVIGRWSRSLRGIASRHDRL
jgi:hypothetical protein